MKKLLFGLTLAACFVAALWAQGKVNPTDPQPTCNMCPGTYIPLSELQAYTKKAVAEKLVDQQQSRKGNARQDQTHVQRFPVKARAARSMKADPNVNLIWSMIHGPCKCRCAMVGYGSTFIDYIYMDHGSWTI